MKISPHEIAFDIDGVVADTFRLFLQKAREWYGFTMDYENITEYEFWKDMFLDRQNIYEIVNSILNQPLEIGIKPIPGAVEVLTRLAEDNSLLFVTARRDRDSILRWLRKYLPGVEEYSIHIEATGASVDKIPVLARYDHVRYFVEDRLETCFLLKNTPVNPIVFDQPWNRKPHPFPIVNGWDDIAAIIEWE